jgi:hypothetical protein
MVFKRSMFRQGPNEPLSEDRFSQVELGIAFKKLTCSHCDFEAIYKYAVQQVRRHAEIRVDEGDEIRRDHQEMYDAIPRFVEIPETLKCKRCKEVLSREILCVF